VGWKSFVAGGILAIFSVACSPTHSDQALSPSQPPAEKPQDLCRPRVGELSSRTFTDWEKKRWISKTYRLLSGGREVSAEQMAKWGKLSRPEVVRELMSQNQFGDFVADFNLFYLGFKPDSLRGSNGSYQADLYAMPHAIRSAQETLACGNYETLLELYQPMMMGQLEAPFEETEDGATVPDSSLPPREIRDRLFEKIQKSLLEISSKVKTEPNRSLKTACLEFNEAVNESVSRWFLMGLPLDFVLGPIMTGLYTPVTIKCLPEVPDEIDFVSELNHILAQSEVIYSQIHQFDRSQYFPQSMDEVRSIDLSKLGLGPSLQFTSKHAGLLQNSSTNYNRKRAAYVLSRFFCDDLTPINVEDFGEHSRGAHGTEPACYSCHHRLDPMAGFFRDYGAIFTNFSKENKIVFDDGASVDREEYQSEWKASPETGRVWNVGYIRSTKDESRNVYGNNLEDLFSIIRQAPEVKQCLARRLFEYVVAEQQVIDAGYLEYLTNQYIQTSEHNTSLALKETVMRLVLSESFLKTDLNPEECYDYAPGEHQIAGPPCRVNHVLQKNCTTCHSSNNRLGGLDLTRWVVTEDGQHNFVHVVSGQGQQSTHRTFASILERLNSTDQNRRMPLRQHMDPSDREALFLWANLVLGESK
jgi:hypothetical protein